MTFTVVPAQSSLTLNIVVAGSYSVIPQPGQNVLIPSSDSLTTLYNGSIGVDVGPGTLEFVPGGAVNAEINGNWLPNSQLMDEAGDQEAADYGGSVTLPFFGTDYLAARGLIFDFSSSLIQFSNGGYPVYDSVNVTSTEGIVYSDGIGPAQGTTDLSGDTGYDEPSSQATLQTTGSTETLTLPIASTDDENVDGFDLELTYTGTLVATATIQTAAPTYYAKLDADRQHVDLWTNSTGTGAYSQQMLVSQFTSLNTSGGAGSVTLDNSAGTIIPAGGLALTGDGNTSLKIVGTGNGDTVSSGTGQFLINNSPVNFNGITQVTFDPVGGTDALSVNSGNLILTAPPAGGGVLVRHFSSINLGAGADLMFASPLSHSDRALMIASALSIAGSAGHWTGTLDLGGNDLDLPGASPVTANNLVASGFNVTTNSFWNGPGIDSSLAAADTTHRSALGMIQNNQSGSALFTSSHLFDGVAPGISDILIKYTYYGDANFSGRVDGSDYSLTDNGFLKHLTGWFNGDFNYDGVVNGSDYTLIDNAYNQQGASLAAQVSAVALRPTAVWPVALPADSVFGGGSGSWPAPAGVAAEIFSDSSGVDLPAKFSQPRDENGRGFTAEMTAVMISRELTHGPRAAI